MGCKMPSTKPVSLSVRFPANLIKRLRVKAKSDRRSLSSLVVILVEKALKQERK